LVYYIIFSFVFMVLLLIYNYNVGKQCPPILNILMITLPLVLDLACMFFFIVFALLFLLFILGFPLSFLFLSLILFIRYVWNDHHVKNLIKEAREEMNYKGIIVLGGPQISYSERGLEGTYPEADVFVRTIFFYIRKKTKSKFTSEHLQKKEKRTK
jgi:hypothetical protein